MPCCVPMLMHRQGDTGRMCCHCLEAVRLLLFLAVQAQSSVFEQTGLAGCCNRQEPSRRQCAKRKSNTLPHICTNLTCCCCICLANLPDKQVLTSTYPSHVILACMCLPCQSVACHQPVSAHTLPGWDMLHETNQFGAYSLPHVCPPSAQWVGFVSSCRSPCIWDWATPAH